MSSTLLNGRIRIHGTGLYVVSATSKTDQAGRGAGNWIEDREDLQLVRRVRAWFAVLRELGANTDMIVAGVPLAERNIAGR